VRTIDERAIKAHARVLARVDLYPFTAPYLSFAVAHLARLHTHIQSAG
jgi:hypothetical protein